MRGPITDTRELFDAVIEVIANNPERHEQGRWTWSPISLAGTPVADIREFAEAPVPFLAADPARPICQTTACVAGWAAILAAPVGSVFLDSEVIRLPPEEEIITIGQYAQTMLHLSDDQANWLFDSDRSRDEVLEGLAHVRDHLYASYDELYDLETGEDEEEDDE